MRSVLYRVLVLSSRVFGTWFFILFSRLIAGGYFLFSQNVPESRRFYAILYPGKSPWYYHWCTFQQYQNFTTIHLDRFVSSHTGPPHLTTEGWDHLKQVIGQQGGILLMSHLGNWEMAAHLLKQQCHDLQMLLYMGVKEKEGVEGLQKEALRRAGVTIIGVNQEDTSPFSAVEGIRCLREGGLVSMTGDLLWRSDQRRVGVSFLGRRAWLPAAPYSFALVSGAPLFAFFTFRIGTNRYHVIASKPIFITATRRRDREPRIAKAAQEYADLLEKTLVTHPFQWYHFKRFVEEKTVTDKTACNTLQS